MDRACRSEHCIDPCRDQRCGTNAQCSVDYHQAKCSCANGLQGNPYVSCTPVGCREHSDCRDNERCDRLSQKCLPLCSPGPCAEGARCEARGHREVCTCRPPLQGDGYAFCTQCKVLE